MSDKSIERLEELERMDLVGVLTEAIMYSSKKPYLKIDNIIDDLNFLIWQSKLAQELNIQNKRQIEALKFYAEPNTYETNVTDQWQPVIPVYADNGKIARLALGDENL